MKRNSTPVRKRLDVTLRKLRSSISNGSSLLVDVDHRSAWMRRLRDLIADHIRDHGGDEMVSGAERILIRRAAMLTLQCEMMEARWSENEGEASAKQIDVYQRTANTLRRLLATLGLERRARDVTPTLGDLLRDDLRRQREEGTRG
jgi:hypothetical protein